MSIYEIKPVTNIKHHGGGVTHTLFRTFTYPWGSSETKPVYHADLPKLASKMMNWLLLDNSNDGAGYDVPATTLLIPGFQTEIQEVLDAI